MVEGVVAGEMRGEEMDGGEVVVVMEGEAGKGLECEWRRVGKVDGDGRGSFR